MELNFEVTREEYIEMQGIGRTLALKEIGRDSTSLVFFFRTFYIGFGVTILAFLDMFQKYDPPVSKDLLFVIIPFLIGLASLFIYSRSARSVYSKKQAEMVGPFPLRYKVTVRADGLHIENKNGSSFIPLTSVQKVKEAAGLICIMTKSFNAFPIKSASFSSADAKSRFVQSLLQDKKPL